MAIASNGIPTPEEHARRLAWFAEYNASLDGTPPRLPLRCPCCGCQTLGERGGWEICEVCFWEDDGQDNHDAEVVRGGPNGSLSLAQARDNYLRLGACEASMVWRLNPANSPKLEEFTRPEDRLGWTVHGMPSSKKKT